MQPAPGTHTPDAQTWVESHAPQSRGRPQPSPTTPQYLPVAAWQTRGMQLAPPTHRPPSQTSPAAQLLPQSIIPKQPLPMTPQYFPFGGLHVTDGVQVPPSVIPRSGRFGRVSMVDDASVP